MNHKLPYEKYRTLSMYVTRFFSETVLLFVAIKLYFGSIINPKTLTQKVNNKKQHQKKSKILKNQQVWTQSTDLAGNQFKSIILFWASSQHQQFCGSPFAYKGRESMSYKTL